MNVRTRAAPSGAPASSRLTRRVGWGIADQGISSLSNFVLGIIAARSLGPEQFGAFTLAFVTFAFVLSASRGPSTDPLMVRFSGADPPVWRPAVAAASGTAVLFGLASGAACVLIGLALPAGIGYAFVALGVGLPGVLLQDSYRFASFSCGRGDRAFANDLLWGVLQTAGLVVLVRTDTVSAPACLLVFGATATVAGLVGALQAAVRPDVRLVRRWLRDHRALGGRYLLENVSLGGARQVRMTAVGMIAGLAAVGQIRAAEILMGPFLIILAGVSQVAVPETREVLEREPRRLPRFCLNLALVQGSIAVGWAVAAATVLPLGLGDLLLGEHLWSSARLLLPPILLGLVFGCFEASAAAGVRGLGASRRSLAAQLSSSTLHVVLGITGTVLWGAAGSCWGVALGNLVGCGIWWWHLRRGTDEHIRNQGSVVI